MTRRSLAPFLFLLLVGVMPVGQAHATDVRTLDVSVDHGVPLTFAVPATSVFIANPDVADVQVMSPKSVMIFGKKTGETSFMATDNAGHTLAQRTVIVRQDLAQLRDDLHEAMPKSHINAEALPNGIILTGEATDTSAVTDAARLAQRYVTSGGEVINRLHIMSSNQIHIRVRFAEVSRNVDRSLGINWQNVGSFGTATIGIATGLSGLGTGSNIIGVRPNNTALNLPNGVIGAAYKSGRFNLNALVDALEQEGFITILAEPNLTALSGETANFLAGGEFPIPIPQGNGAISIQFKPYGISLSFTPTLIGDNRINLHVKPEVSELTTTGSIVLSNIAIPAITTRKAETTIEVGSGESFAIAGLLDNNQTQTVNKYPLLGDLPILGPLFRSDRFQSGETELIIIITPYIVRPTEEKMALPMDGFAQPNEAEHLLEMRHSSANPAMRPLSGDPVAVLPPPNANDGTPPAKETTESNVQQAPVLATPLQAVPSTPTAAPAPEAAPREPVSVVETPRPVSSVTNGFILE